MTNLKSPPLGQLLVETGAVSREALASVLEAQRTDKRRLGELLVERGLVRPHQLAQLLSHQLSCPWVSLPRMQIEPAVAALLPRAVVVEHEVVPVHLRANGKQKVLYVAIVDPTDEHALAECATACGLAVKPMIAITAEIRAAIAAYYPSPDAPPAVTASPAPPPPQPINVHSAHTVPPPPPPPTDEELHLEDDDVISVVGPEEQRRATIVTLSAPEPFLEQVRGAVAESNAEILDGNLLQAADLVAKHKPCAIVLTEDVYAFDRVGLSRLAIDNDAVLVVWNEDADRSQLEPLLASALARWRHAPYEKGAIVDGRYELLRDLGGPLATSSWEVRHTRTGRRAHLHLAAGQDDAAGVGRQQLALARVSHPGAVDLRDAGKTENGDPYILLELVEGKTLEGIVAARGKLPPARAATIITELAHTLQSAHAANVLHGAVSSDNVVLVRDAFGAEHVKLTGWQSAVLVDDELDARKDVAALARCAFEALAGRKPGPDDDLGADVAPDVAVIVKRALAGEGSLVDLVAAVGRAAPLVATEPRTSASAAPAEQRRFPRAPYRTPVRIEVAGIGNVDGRTEDISARGLYVLARKNVAPNSEVRVRFALPIDGKVVSENATVKWVREASSAEGAGLTAVGIELGAPSAETLRQIEKYVSLMSSGPS